jgi:hypothetical protein
MVLYTQIITYQHFSSNELLAEFKLYSIQAILFNYK